MKTDKPTPLTFEAPAYALLDEDANGVLTTQHGNLAIFTVKGMADAFARSSRRKIKVVTVTIQPVTEQ